MHEPICLFETLIAKRWRDIEAISHKYPETSVFGLKKHYPRAFDILIILPYTQISAKKHWKKQCCSTMNTHLLSHDRALWIAWAEPGWPSDGCWHSQRLPPGRLASASRQGRKQGAGSDLGPLGKFNMYMCGTCILDGLLTKWDTASIKSSNLRALVDCRIPCGRLPPLHHGTLEMKYRHSSDAIEIRTCLRSVSRSCWPRWQFFLVGRGPFHVAVNVGLKAVVFRWFPFFPMLCFLTSKRQSFTNKIRIAMFPFGT